MGVLGGLLLVRGCHHDPGAGRDFAVRLRSEGNPDVRVVVDGEHAGVELADHDRDEPYVELDVAARTLVIWGRRPDQRGRLRSHMPVESLTRLQALLSGY